MKSLFAWVPALWVRLMGPVLSPQRHFFNVRNYLISSLQFFLMEGNPIASRWSARVAHWWIWQYWWAFNWCFLFVLCPCLSQTPFEGCEGVKQCWLFALRFWNLSLLGFLTIRLVCCPCCCPAGVEVLVASCFLSLPLLILMTSCRN